MADSIQYQIAENLVDSLSIIQTSGGYSVSVPANNIQLAKVLIETPDPSNPSIVVDIGDIQTENDRYHTLEQVMNFTIFFFNVHDSDNPCITEDNKNIFADITKALKIDPTRGNIAQYTETKSNGNGFGDDGSLYTYVSGQVKYTVNGQNPYVN